jgi:immune inhibitor A
VNVNHCATLSSKYSQVEQYCTAFTAVFRIICVVVEFQDVKCPPGTIERTQDLWFSTGGKIPTGSVTEYYSEVSNNAISLTGEVIGPFTLKEKMAYYANNRGF